MKNLHRAFIALGIVLFWGLWSLTLAQVMTSRNSANNNVPDYYYSNYKFRDDWDAITEWFTKAQAKFSLGQEVSSSEFSELSKHFDTTVKLHEKRGGAGQFTISFANRIQMEDLINKLSK